MAKEHPDIQLISNVVVRDDQGSVLLVKYDPEDERWWLPGDDLRPYQHPDERAREVLAPLTGLVYEDLALVFIESFRGRRGWHVMFNYRAKGSGEPDGDIPFAWFPSNALPRTMHGKWEQEVVRRVIESACG